MEEKKYIGCTGFPETPLVRQAMDMPCTRWYEIYPLMGKTADPEELEALRVILNGKYHLEEGNDI